MPSPHRRHVTDIAALRALANPVRYRILGHLMAMGPQTASECAAVVGATPSNCSYHLRELARYGLVERVEDGAGDGRERPWRPTATGWQFHPEEDDDPVAEAVSVRLQHAGIDDDARLAHAAIDAHDTQPEDWRSAEASATYGLRVTAGELAALVAAVDALLRPYIGLTREEVPAARPVHASFRAFLRPTRP